MADYVALVEIDEADAVDAVQHVDRVLQSAAAAERQIDLRQIAVDHLSLIHISFRLAAFLHQQGLAGRDKVTLALSRSLGGAALWTKQNFEESLGKSEQLGLKLIINEPLRMADYRAPKDARQDRAFLLVGRQGEPAADRRKLMLLRRSGYPLADVYKRQA